jgi:hypothetical protein
MKIYVKDIIKGIVVYDENMNDIFRINYESNYVNGEEIYNKKDYKKHIIDILNSTSNNEIMFNLRNEELKDLLDFKLKNNNKSFDIVTDIPKKIQDKRFKVLTQKYINE